VKILVINGPNLNMLGKREKEFYGDITLEMINANLDKIAKSLNVEIQFFQSNLEGAIIEKIHGATDIDGMIINLGAYTHTSIAIRDALSILKKPFVEVHLSNIYSREAFRHKSFISDLAVGVIAGFKEESYYLALNALVNYLKSNKS